MTHAKPDIRCVRPLALAALTTAGLIGLAGCGDAPAAATEEREAEAADMGLGPDPAFEWMGVYELPAGRVELAFQPGPDETMGVALVPVGPDAAPPFAAAVGRAGSIGESEATHDDHEGHDESKANHGEHGAADPTSIPTPTRLDPTPAGSPRTALARSDR